MKFLISIAIFLIFYQALCENALCSEPGEPFLHEMCFIDDSYVLLYKIINWWNDSIPEDDTLPCGNRIKCQSIGKTKVEYSEPKKTLSLHLNGDFDSLISIFKQCKRCFGPSYFECTWLNKKYFGNGAALAPQRPSDTINLLSFRQITKEHADNIQSNEKEIAFVVEGMVGGLLLLDGKIALHQAGEFLKSCPKLSQSQEETFPISLIVINDRTKEVMAKYSAVFDNNSF